MNANDYRDVISCWPSISALAADVGEKVHTVEKWRTRNSIPAKAWQRVIDAAEGRGIPVTAEMLTSLASEAA